MPALPYAVISSPAYAFVHLAITELNATMREDKKSIGSERKHERSRSKWIENMKKLGWPKKRLERLNKQPKKQPNKKLPQQQKQKSWRVNILSFRRCKIVSRC